MTKQQQRTLVRELKRQLTPDVLARAEHSLLQALHELPLYQQARTVLLYASLADEVPTLQLLERREKRFVLPCVVDESRLELRAYTGPDDLEICGRYRIPEPTGPLFTDLAAIDLAIIPGMAFDREGHRLGRGKGYYDRLLCSEHLSTIPKYGLCFDFQLLDSVDHEPHDVTMDHLIVVPTK